MSSYSPTASGNTSPTASSSIPAADSNFSPRLTSTPPTTTVSPQSLTSSPVTDDSPVEYTGEMKRMYEDLQKKKMEAGKVKGEREPTLSKGAGVAANLSQIRLGRRRGTADNVAKFGDDNDEDDVGDKDGAIRNGKRDREGGPRYDDEAIQDDKSEDNVGKVESENDKDEAGQKHNASDDDGEHHQPIARLPTETAPKSAALWSPSRLRKAVYSIILFTLAGLLAIFFYTAGLRHQTENHNVALWTWDSLNTTFSTHAAICASSGSTYDFATAAHSFADFPGMLIPYATYIASLASSATVSAVGVEDDDGMFTNMASKPTDKMAFAYRNLSIHLIPPLLHAVPQLSHNLTRFCRTFHPRYTALMSEISLLKIDRMRLERYHKNFAMAAKVQKFFGVTGRWARATVEGWAADDGSSGRGGTNNLVKDASQGVVEPLGVVGKVIEEVMKKVCQDVRTSPSSSSASAFATSASVGQNPSFVPTILFNFLSLFPTMLSFQSSSPSHPSPHTTPADAACASLTQALALILDIQRKATLVTEEIARWTEDVSEIWRVCEDKGELVGVGGV